MSLAQLQLILLTSARQFLPTHPAIAFTSFATARTPHRHADLYLHFRPPLLLPDFLLQLVDPFLRLLQLARALAELFFSRREQILHFLVLLRHGGHLAQFALLDRQPQLRLVFLHYLRSRTIAFCHLQRLRGGQ